MRHRCRTPRRAAGAAAALLLGLLGCAKKEPIVAPPPPEPVRPDTVFVAGNRVIWGTDGPARGSVRYGFRAGSYDHMAYPDAAGRADRALQTEHSVALLDLQPGRAVHYQAVNESAGGITYSDADSFVAAAGSPSNLLVATMIHIGFGDSHLLRMPTTGKNVLLDCGGRGADQSVETYLRDHGVTRIDGMLATHVHEDHLGGVVGSWGSTTDGVLGDYAPPVFFDSPLKSEASRGRDAYEELLNSIPATTRRLLLARGDSSENLVALQFDPAVSILCLNSGVPPGYRPVSYVNTNINNESIVLKFTYGDVDFIIGGDAEQESEAIMLASWPAATLEVEYYKASHHGLSDASSSGWVNALRPRVAFIPNTGLVWEPPPEFAAAIGSTVGKLQAVGAHVYVIDEARALDRPRTGTQYNVSFVTDGRSYEVRLERATQSVPTKTAQSFGCVQHALHAHGAQEAPEGGL
jgi:hypothetical protein